MKCYRDMTFCPFGDLCKDGEDCGKALTDDVIRGAKIMELPVAQFVSPPECFKDVRAEEEEQ